VELSDSRKLMPNSDASISHPESRDERGFESISSAIEQIRRLELLDIDAVAKVNARSDSL
jgi:hypothetical protein